MSSILALDDEQDMLALLSRIISEKSSHGLTTLSDPSALTQLLQDKSFDVVLTDLKMPGKNGIQVLEEVKQKSPRTAVIIMTGYGTIESALEATRKGAFDYITKPFRKERILHVIEQALNWQTLQKENIYLRQKLEEKSSFPTLVGSTLAMRSLHDEIRKVAKTSATVLITGSSGTGKELVARALHSQSLRSEQQFIPIDCSTIPESIIESELFGHVKGSFTGAIRNKKGMVEEANHGTLFLDEIADLSPAMQVKLLRLLQEGEYKMVGSNAICKVDIRFIAATNQNLSEKIRKGEFREDLYYRLNVINIQLPALSERRDDIPPLANHFLEKYNSLHSKNVKRISNELMQHLLERNWRGNVRELENVIERGVIMAAGDSLELTDALSFGQAPKSCSQELSQSSDLFSIPFKEAKDKLIDQFHAEYITRVLSRNDGNVSKAARESGLKRQYLHRLIREIKLDSKCFKKDHHH
ncbi:MAG TPA: sigma-54-dependent Fis family transcriptional regulator [Deltaproteobacteria bacterium]|nr:sigma-54-dependent Fis family transcriptional regulator [Deltaproteobacteria bacterium]